MVSINIRYDDVRVSRRNQYTGDGTVPMRVSVYDILGREVAVMHDGLVEPGHEQFQWRVDAVRPGMYYIVATAKGKRSVRAVAVVE
jgi:hypothetical protein